MSGAESPAPRQEHPARASQHCRHGGGACPTERTDLERVVSEANRDIGQPHRDIPAPGEPAAPTSRHFELYHGAPSLRSHEVRFTLAK
jgi:hypothetical protein